MKLPIAEPPAQWGDDLLIARKFALQYFLGGMNNESARFRERNPEKYPHWPTPQPMRNGRPGYSVGHLRRFYAASQQEPEAGDAQA